MDNLITLEVNERRQVTTDYVVITIHLIVQHKNRHLLIKQASMERDNVIKDDNITQLQTRYNN